MADRFKPVVKKTTPSKTWLKRTKPPKMAARMRDARYALFVLTAMNLLNYLDRYVPSAVKDLFKDDLRMTDAETALPLTAFVIVYMIASPVFGAWSERMSRPKLIAFGVLLWSLATAGAAMSAGFYSFFVARAMVGIGEAAYATISPALLSDFYPSEQRNRVLTFFYVAIPVGAALGFTLGGVVGQHYGWRAAFLVAGLPGILTSLLVWRIKDPGKSQAQTTAPVSWAEALSVLWRSKEYVVAVAGYTLVTFASGGMADWFPTYLSRERGFSLAEAGSVVGTMTVVGGLGGTIVGGLLGDYLRGRTRHPYLATSALSIIPASVFSALAMTTSDKTAISACVLLAQFFLWFYNGPINTIIVNSVPAPLRARAFSVSILAIHLLGDAISPPVIGLISDHASLAIGMALVPLMLALSAMVWLLGWRLLPESQTT